MARGLRARSAQKRSSKPRAWSGESQCPERVEALTGACCAVASRAVVTVKAADGRSGGALAAGGRLVAHSRPKPGPTCSRRSADGRRGGSDARTFLHYLAPTPAGESPSAGTGRADRRRGPARRTGGSTTRRVLAAIARRAVATFPTWIPPTRRVNTRLGRPIDVAARPRAADRDVGRGRHTRRLQRQTDSDCATWAGRILGGPALDELRPTQRDWRSSSRPPSGPGEPLGGSCGTTVARAGDAAREAARGADAG